MNNMSPEAMAAWGKLRASFGRDLHVNSAHRTEEHNARVGGAKNSQHIHGNAFDVGASGMSRDERAQLIQQARASGFNGIGVYDNSLHFDVGGERAWGADYTRNSLPEWARNALAGQAPQEQHAGHSQPLGQPVGTPQNALLPPQQLDLRQDPRAFQNALIAPQATLSFDQFRV